MTAELIWLALATFASEDLACIAAGLAVASGRLAFVPAAFACTAGIVAGDLLLYLCGRWASHRVLYRWIPQERLERAASWLNERGLRVVFISRFTPGLRLPTYVAAGALRVGLPRFALYLLLAGATWTPLLVVLAAVAGERAAQSFVHAIAAAAGMLAFLYFVRLAANWKVRRRVIGFIGRWTRWEFWPAWLVYLPVVCYIAMLALRHRSLTLFTIANPGIPDSGFAGESKWEILSRIAGDGVAPTRRIRRGERIHVGAFPVVLKPDTGERGRGVAVIRSASPLQQYLEAATGDVLLQPRLGEVEFGVYYYRMPGEAAGHILSVTEKRFPIVTGDGRRTIEQLVLGDKRAVCIAGIYLRNHDPGLVPKEGEPVTLAELGSHCRGAIFLDGRRHLTAQVRGRLEEISARFEGFYFGRYDIRADSVEAFERGEFFVIELNGVTAEPAHIYDPSVSIVAAYRALFEQWRIAFDIGAANRKLGYEPAPVGAVLRRAWQHLGGAPSGSVQYGQPQLRISGMSSPNS